MVIQQVAFQARPTLVAVTGALLAPTLPNLGNTGARPGVNGTRAPVRSLLPAIARQVPVTFLNDALSELVTLASPPALAEALAADDLPEAPLFTLDDQALALRAIEAGVDEARASGARAAVCLADLAPTDIGPKPSSATLDAADAWLLRRLRATDRLYRVGSVLVVVATGLDHPHEAERLAERVRTMPVGPDLPVVGLAIYPLHGEDAETLFGRARASARRVRLQRASRLEALAS